MIDEKLKTIQLFKTIPKGELYFKGPYSKPIIKYLTLINLSDKKACFRITTNANDLFCIWPDNGKIFSNCSIKVMILFKPLSQFIDQRKLIREYENKIVVVIQTIFLLNKKRNSEKPYVQSLIIYQSILNQKKIWQNVHPLAIKESILNCVFELPSFIYRINRLTKAKQILKIKLDKKIKKISLTGLNFVSNAKFIILLNPSNDRVFFEIKTLSPFNCFIKPNNVIIEAKSFIKVAIISPPIYKNYDEKKSTTKINYNFKFLIQSVLAPDNKNIKNITLNDVDPLDIMESIFECYFDLFFEKCKVLDNNVLSPFITSYENKNIDDDLYGYINNMSLQD